MIINGVGGVPGASTTFCAVIPCFVVVLVSCGRIIQRIFDEAVCCCVGACFDGMWVLPLRLQ